MMKWKREVRLYIRVAGVAELWFGDFEHMLTACEGMITVAVYAANATFAMRRALKVRVYPCVAAQAFLVHHLGCRLGELE